MMIEKVPYREFILQDYDHGMSQFVVCNACHALVMDLFPGDWEKHVEWHSELLDD